MQQGQTDGWLGADAAYSIPLHDGRDVWIFGDTLYGKSRVVRGDAPQMVRNSIGVSTCGPDGKWSLQYVIRKDATGHPRDFFTAQHPHTWYWALDGFVANHNLWVTLLCVRSKPNADSPAMAFEACGADLARVSDLNVNPQQWKIDYFPLVPDGTNAYPTSTAVVHGKYAYLFALYDSGSRPLLVTRIPLNGLHDPQKHLEYLTKDGAWKDGFHPVNAMAVMKMGSPELSIRYHPELKQWIAVMFAPEGHSGKITAKSFPGNILLRAAPHLTGPWTQGQVIYQVPEMQPNNPGHDKDTFCYAGKEHPEFEKGDLVFTYVCNSLSVPKLGTNLNIYFPKVVRMPMPESPR